MYMCNGPGIIVERFREHLIETGKGVNYNLKKNYNQNINNISGELDKLNKHM